MAGAVKICRLDLPTPPEKNGRKKIDAIMTCEA
jgi:hypothetical protein